MGKREQSASRGDGLVGEGSSIEERALAARQAYEKESKLYAEFAESVAEVLRKCLRAAAIRVHEIAWREKDPDSFEQKAAKRKPDNPDEPKYFDPLTQITDKAAVRIITYILSEVESVCAVIEQEFDVVEHPEDRERDPDRLGYASVHYLISFAGNRSGLTDYLRYKGLVAEVQVRTILQHAWAEIEHDIQYKAVVKQPSKVTRGFRALAGTIELADQEFQRLSSAEQSLTDQAVAHVNDGRYANVEIRRDSVRAYLADKFGRDGPDTDISYDWTVRVLLALGFKDLADLDQCIKGADVDRISRVINGPERPDHLGRLDAVLLACMGENYLLAHPWARNDQLARGFIPTELEKLGKLRTAGLKVGDYRPANYPQIPSYVRDLVSDLKARPPGQGDAASW